MEVTATATSFCASIVDGVRITAAPCACVRGPAERMTGGKRDTLFSCCWLCVVCWMIGVCLLLLVFWVWCAVAYHQPLRKLSPHELVAPQGSRAGDDRHWHALASNHKSYFSTQTIRVSLVALFCVLFLQAGCVENQTIFNIVLPGLCLQNTEKVQAGVQIVAGILGISELCPFSANRFARSMLTLQARTHEFLTCMIGLVQLNVLDSSAVQISLLFY